MLLCMVEFTHRPCCSLLALTDGQMQFLVLVCLDSARENVAIDLCVIIGFSTSGYFNFTHTSWFLRLIPHDSRCLRILNIVCFMDLIQFEIRGNSLETFQVCLKTLKLVLNLKTRVDVYLWNASLQIFIKNEITEGCII
ncbi:hypothetical protein BVRB_1g007250 [Beta vulgaris subsp. vulgaris]|nr:hypothetical protein BVRB_1g007250 [Beta vulgaris subsp. vulgaris]